MHCNILKAKRPTNLVRAGMTRYFHKK